MKNGNDLVFRNGTPVLAMKQIMPLCYMLVIVVIPTYNMSSMDEEWERPRIQKWKSCYSNEANNAPLLYVSDRSKIVLQRTT